MEELERIIQKIEEHRLDFDRCTPYLKHINEGCWKDITSGEANYYKYFASMMEVLKPKQVVELGGSAGVCSLMILSHLPNDSRLYSISIPEPEIEFRFIKEDYPNLTMIRGNDLDMNNWKDVDLSKTDICFIDTDHNYWQVHQEIELYFPKFKPGTLVFFDDIDLNDDMKRVWKEVPGTKLSLPTWHWSGFGVTRI